MRIDTGLIENQAGPMLVDGLRQDIGQFRKISGITGPIRQANIEGRRLLARGEIALRMDRQREDCRV